MARCQDNIHNPSPSGEWTTLALIADPVPGYPSQTSQDAASCLAVASRFLRFISKAAADAAADQAGGLPATLAFGSAEDEGRLKRAAGAVAGEHGAGSPTANVRVSFHPQYGAAVVRHTRIGSGQCLRRYFEVVGLDRWSHTVHGASGDHREHGASCGGATVLFVGSCPVTQEAQVDAEMRNQWSKVQERTGKQRHAKANGTRGHQRTPALVASIIGDALSSCAATAESGESEPVGGFTDVGQHTGGQPRCTIWPLVAACFAHVLNLRLEEDVFREAATQPSALFHRSQALFALHLLEGAVQAAVRTAADAATAGHCLQPRFLNMAMRLLELAQEHGETLAGDMEAGGTTDAVRAFVGAVEGCRQRLDHARDAAAETDAARFRLQPPTLPLHELYRDPTAVLPRRAEKVPALARQPATGDLKELALKNLGWLPTLEPTDDPEDVQQWVQDSRWQAASHCPPNSLLLVETMEEFVLRLARDRLGSGAPEDLGVAQRARQVAALDTIWRRYHTESDTEECVQGQRSPAEHAGKRVLFHWACYCLVHQLCEASYSTMREFAVCLRYRDLRHLVLGDKLLRDTARTVADYLHSRDRKSRSEGVLFSTRAGEATDTDNFAASFVETDLCNEAQELKGQVDEEHQRQDAEVEARWKIVQEKKSKLRELRSTLSTKKSERERAARAYQNCRCGWDCRYGCSYARSRDSLDVDISSLESRIGETNRAPQELKFPISRASYKTRARQEMFFLRMPPSLRLLAAAGRQAQSSLVSTQTGADDGSQSGSVKEWADWFNGHKITIHSSKRPAVNVTSNPEVQLCYDEGGEPKDRVGSATVDGIYDTTNGVWWPDGFTHRMKWPHTDPFAEQGSSSGARASQYHRAFSASSVCTTVTRVRRELTTQLPGREFRGLQWMVKVDAGGGNDPTRSNQAIARLSDRPSSVRKDEYLALGALRAQPRAQLHRLCAALERGLLHLDRPLDVALVRQLVWQIGDIAFPAAGGGVQNTAVFDWHNHTWSNPGFLPYLATLLGRSSSDILDAPKDYGKVELLGDLLGFFADYRPQPIDNPFAVSLANLRAAAWDWATALQADLEESERGDGSSRRAILAKQAIFYHNALLCYRNGPFGKEECGELLRLVVLCRKCRPTHASATASVQTKRDEKEALRLAALAAQVMAKRAPRIVELVGAGSQALLGGAVSEVFSSLPAGLNWERVERVTMTACYHALDESDNLFSINALTGVFLYNGLPPARLPLSVTSLPCYKRHFGARNFDVVQGKRDEWLGLPAFRTTRNINGCQYRFVAAAAGGVGSAKKDPLRVYELEPEAGGGDGFTVLELLMDPRPVWPALPRLLVQEHSHWICRAQKAIVLRGTSYTERTVQFAGRWWAHDVSGATTVAVALYKIPAHLRKPCDNGRYVAQEFFEQAPQRYHLLRVPAAAAAVTGAAKDGGAPHPHQVLGKFEEQQYLHIYTPPPPCLRAPPVDHDQAGAPPPPQATVVYEFARFPNLEVSLCDDDHFYSAAHRGWVLSHSQQLDDALYNCSAYLVLESETAKGPGGEPLRQLLVPAGLVTRVEPVAELHATRPGTPEEFEGPDELEDAEGNLESEDALEPLEPLEPPKLAPVRVAINTNGLARCAFRTFSVHPRYRYLEAPDVESRLQLAAMHAACSSLLPERRLQMTGAEAACKLVRQCWKNQPLAERRKEARTPGEAQQLCNVLEFSGTCPTLALLVQDVYQSSRQFANLHADREEEDEEGEAETPWAIPPQADAATQYRLAVSREACNLRHHLAPDEASRLGLCGGEPRILAPAACACIDLPPQCVVDAAELADTEANLRCLTSQVSQEEHEAFPLPECAGGMFSEDIYGELRESWHAETTLERFTVNVPPEVVLSRVRGYLNRARDSINRLLAHLGELVGAGEGAARPSAFARRMRKASNRLPVLSQPDLARMAFLDDCEVLLRFNPQLASALARRRVKSTVLLWLSYCVLEDRLLRIEGMLVGGDADERIVRELRMSREWDVTEHPEWLAFEVAGGIQIRPVQYAVARQMLAEEGNVQQLNMGEGKTRVILPMLVMHVLGRRRQHPGQLALPRLHFLPQLLEEAYQFLHQRLCASELHIKLLRLPFHRDVEVTPESAMIQQHVLAASAASSRAVLLVSPEHRLSLQLRCVELHLQAEKAEAKAAEVEEEEARKAVEEEAANKTAMAKKSTPSKATEASATRTTARALRDEAHVCQETALHLLKMESGRVTFWDVFDESDALLRPTYQVIYAYGERLDLPHRRTRSDAAMAVLRVLSESTELKVMLDKWVQEGSAKRSGGEARSAVDAPRRLGQFSGVTLTITAEQEQQFVRELAECLFRNPPRQMRWISLWQDGSKPVLRMDEFRRLLCDVSKPFEALLSPALQNQLTKVERTPDLLALRGLLGHGVLAHALSQRHNVDFGIDRHSVIPDRTRMAVPYRASQTPAPRAEFAHPDLSIAVTLISYLQDGLREEQCIEAFGQLLRLSDTAKEKTYGEWFELSRRHGLADSDAARLDHVRKIDLSNSVLRGLLVRVYRHNMETIAFWVATVIFPDETRQYTHRLLKTSWDLCARDALGSPGVLLENRHCGFSGTNDTRALLPGDMHQEEPATPELRATNGKMLAILNEIPKECLVPEDAWEALRWAVVDQGCQAFIDAGAMLASHDNSAVAARLLSLLPQSKEPLQGVVFPDGAGRWRLRSHEGEWQLGAAPLKAKDCFVFYDQSRTRGADHKMLPQARAMLTIGKGLTKDALMQAAGRMRQLLRQRRGQRLVLCLTKEVDCAMRRHFGRSALTAQHVLQFVIANTDRLLQTTMPLKIGQGMHHVHTRSSNKPADELVEETIALADMYADSRRKEQLGAVYDRRYGHVLRAAAESGTNVTGNLVQRMDVNKARYGAHIHVYVGSKAEKHTSDASEECEREMQREQEQEQEREVESAPVFATEETPWEYEDVLGCMSCAQLRVLGIKGMVSLRQYIDKVFAADRSVQSGMREICWSDDVFVTQNFAEPVRGSPNPGYMRPVNPLLLFPDGTVLLLSEGEQEGMLRLCGAAKSASRDSQGPTLTSFAMLRAHLDSTAGRAGAKGGPLAILLDENTVPCYATARHPKKNLASLAPVIACLELISGVTDFQQSRLGHVRSMLPNKAARTACGEFAHARGRGVLLDQSHLLELCTQEAVLERGGPAAQRRK